MPFKSQAQSNYTHGVASGNIKPERGGMTQQAAQKMVADSRGQSTKNLPPKVSRKASK